MNNNIGLLLLALLLITKTSFGQDLPKFVHVQGGTFTMGDEKGKGNKDQRPTHKVTLNSFNLSQTEVTVAQYRYYCNETGVRMPKKPSWGWQNNHPIVNISWQDAINYTNWLSGKLDQKVRLPYEAEWEFAARGGNKSKGYKYSGSNNLTDVSWHDGNSKNKTNSVAVKKANELGLYDMSGNAFEWCMDKYGGDYYANSPKENPKGATEGDTRVVRGGGWNLGNKFSSVAFRYGSRFTGELYEYFGFRVASNKKQGSKTTDSSTIEKPYLGQKPPGMTPIPFAPGLVSTDIYEYSSAFTPDMKSFYFVRRGEKNIKSTFYEYKYNETNKTWEKSVVASPWIGRPVISPDGNTMHLGTRYLKRTDTGWSKRHSLDPPIVSNDSMFIMRLSSSANGTYYFDTYKKGDLTFPIRYSRLINGKHEEPKALPKAINTGTFLSHPFIAPDESYLLWDAKKENGYGDSDIYISFKQKDGTWGSGINLGDKINTPAWEASPSITPDGKYLFFSRNVGSENYENVDIFWVDAKVIKTLRPKK